MFPRLQSSFIALVLVVLTISASADIATLYLLNGTSVRGEIVDRSGKSVQLKTASGLVKLKTANLMPISRQQLKLPAEVEKEDVISADSEALLTQMEKLVAENAALKQELNTLKAQLAKMSPAADEIKAPAEGPAVGH